MITKFSVSSFKNFKNEFTLDLCNVSNYPFSRESIKNGIVNNAIIYGKNGVGKSNLGLAIFDIISHLTNNETNKELYKNYQNAQSGLKEVSFHYEFLIDSKKIVYEYKKTSSEIIIFEKFSIDGEVFAEINKKQGLFFVKFKGAKNLIANFPEHLSLLKYIKNNTVFEEDTNNRLFQKFYDFIEKMLFFRSLQDRFYIGLEAGTRIISQDIIERNNVLDLQNFLKIAGIKCKLSVEKTISDERIIAIDFGNKKIDLFHIASQGTKALLIFYFWLQRIREEATVSFLFIDEFDAFYHYELSKFIVEKLKKTGIQFMLTTHNTSIMTNDLLNPDCYFIMNSEQIKSFSNCSQKELRETNNIEKMYKAGLFDVE